MNTSKKLRITITLLSLAAVLCVLLGKSIIYVPGFTLSYSFIDALFPPADTSFLPSTTIYVWILVIGSLITCVLVWLRRKREFAHLPCDPQHPKRVQRFSDRRHLGVFYAGAAACIRGFVHRAVQGHQAGINKTKNRSVQFARPFRAAICLNGVRQLI